MPIRQLTASQIEALVGTQHLPTGIEYPPDGLQPYYDWLMRSIHQLAECSAGALKVFADQAGDTSVVVAPGRATLAGAALAFAGDTVDLAAHNNAAALLWLYDDQGDAAVGVGPQTAGWPTDPHVKLAEVTLAAGQITAILDRRAEHLFAPATLRDLGITAGASEINQLCDGVEPGLDSAALNAVFASGLLAGTTGASFTVNLGAAGPRLVLSTQDAAGDHGLTLKPGTLSGDRAWTFPDASDTVVGLATTQTLTNKTLTSPAIGDFAQALHDHGSDGGGGLLAAASTARRGAVLRMTNVTDAAEVDDDSGGTPNAGTIQCVDVDVTEPAGSPTDAAALRDDLVANTLPDIETGLSNLRDAVATLACAQNDLVGKVNQMLDGLVSAGLMAN